MPDFLILDSEMQPQHVIDDFNSMLWVERYNDMGLFKLVGDRRNYHLRNMDRKTRIGKSDSRYFMMVDDVDDDFETGLVTVTGRTADKILTKRISLNSDAYTAGNSWFLKNVFPTGASVTVVRNAVSTGYTPTDYYCAIPNMSVTNSAGNVGTQSTFEIPIQEAFTNVKNLLDSVDVGWRMRRTYDSLTINFDIYKGVDKTAFDENTILFSPERDNFRKGVLRRRENGYATNGFMLNGGALYYKLSPYQETLDTGFDSSFIAIDAEDIKNTGVTFAELSDALNNRTNSAFRERLQTSYVDGEVVSAFPGRYIYGTDYNLGDLVRATHDGGPSFDKNRVVEHTTSVDQEGVREFPTLEPVITV